MKVSRCYCCKLDTFFVGLTIGVIAVEVIWILILTACYTVTIGANFDEEWYNAMDDFYFKTDCRGKEKNSKCGSANKKFPLNFITVIFPLYLLMIVKVYQGLRWLLKGQTRRLYQNYYYTSVSFYVAWCYMIILILMFSY